MHRTGKLLIPASWHWCLRSTPVALTLLGEGGIAFVLVVLLSLPSVPHAAHGPRTPFQPSEGPCPCPSSGTDLPAPHPVPRHFNFLHQSWAWVIALSWPTLPCCHHLSAWATCPQPWDRAGRWGDGSAALQPPALGMQPHSCCSLTLSILPHSLSDILLELWILICRTNVLERPKIRHQSMRWFPTHPGG